MTTGVGDRTLMSQAPAQGRENAWHKDKIGLDFSHNCSSKSKHEIAFNC